MVAEDVAKELLTLIRQATTWIEVVIKGCVWLTLSLITDITHTPLLLNFFDKTKKVKNYQAVLPADVYP